MIFKRKTFDQRKYLSCELSNSVNKLGVEMESICEENAVEIEQNSILLEIEKEQKYIDKQK